MPITLVARGHAGTGQVALSVYRLQPRSRCGMTSPPVIRPIRAMCWDGARDSGAHASVLTRGDGIALVSPASWSGAEAIAETTVVIASWGFRPRLVAHAHDRLGYLAGADQDRLADLNYAIHEPEATALHRVWHAHGVPSLHGAVGGVHHQVMRDVLTGGTPARVATDPLQFGAELTTGGRATGTLFGGNLEMLARSVGVLDFDMRGHILLLEINRSAGLGHVDRALTQLILAGALEGVVGVALGWLSGFEEYADRGWTVIDVLADRLGMLDVPILAGLHFWHGPEPIVAPLGVPCTIDADAGTVALSSALQGRRGGDPAKRRT